MFGSALTSDLTEIVNQVNLSSQIGARNLIGSSPALALLSSKEGVQQVPFDQPTLQFGDSGPEVTRLQEDLTAVGCFSDIADGSFGQSTLDAVTLFQSAVGLTADGVVDENTWSVLEGPEATVEESIDISDLPAMSLAVSHASDQDASAYLADLGIDSGNIG